MTLTVALIGPDGSGKTTIARRLAEDPSLGCEYLYMGVNPEGSNRQLLSTRIAWSLKRRRGHRPDTGPPERPGAPRARTGPRRVLRDAARTANLIVEEWYRQLLIRRRRRAGVVVLLDRDFWADYHAHDIAAPERPWPRRVHGWVLTHLYRKPDLLVHLEAPGVVLFARKGEGTVEALDARQRDYRALAGLGPRVEAVDATQPLDAVVATIADLIRAAVGTSAGAGRTVLVTDAARASAVVTVRSLTAAGWRVIAADPRPAAAGGFCRGVAARVRYPDPASEPEAAVEALARAVREHGVDLLVPVTDDVGAPLHAHRDALPATCTVALPGPAARAVVDDKALTLELAEQTGVPVPKTVVTADVDEAVAAAEALGWPAVIKPARSRRYRPGAGVTRHEVRFATSAEEVAEHVRAAAGAPVLVQEHCPGEGVGVELLAVDGEIRAAFQHRRLRQVPLSGGPSALRESVPVDPRLLEHSSALLRSLRWTGLAMVEFTDGPAGPRLMEINGRIWGSLGLAVEAGVDFPRLLADALTGAPATPTATPRAGVRTRNLELELRWILAVARDRRPAFVVKIPRREAVAVALRLLLPRPRFDVQRATDPLPGLLDLVRIVTRSRSAA